MRNMGAVYMVGVVVCIPAFMVSLYRNWRGEFPKQDARQALSVSLLGIFFALLWPAGILGIACLTEFWRHGFWRQRRSQSDSR